MVIRYDTLYLGTFVLCLCGPFALFLFCFLCVSVCWVLGVVIESSAADADVVGLGGPEKFSISGLRSFLSGATALCNISLLIGFQRMK